MPVISVTPQPLTSYLLVRINWSDSPAVTCAKVTRTNTENGATSPLRAYIAPCSTGEGCIQLSGNQAVFWDTEAPLDTQFSYTTEACTPEGLTISFTTEPFTMPSGGNFYLKDPVRPCNDQVVLVDAMRSPNCPPGRGIFFISMGVESYAPNSVDLLPVNASLPLTISRARRSVTATLTLATRSFPDRDALLIELEPGSPLLFQGPPNYGIPDRYISVGNVDVGRGLPDIRYQPRLFSIPFAATQRPAGTTQGICGARFQDLCDIHATWDDIEAAGLTYEDLLLGKASNVAPVTFRTWDDIEAAYADWDAVEAGNDDWDDVRDGA